MSGLKSDAAVKADRHSLGFSLPELVSMVVDCIDSRGTLATLSTVNRCYNETIEPKLWSDLPSLDPLAWTLCPGGQLHPGNVYIVNLIWPSR